MVHILIVGKEAKLLSDITQGLQEIANVEAFYTNSCHQALDYISRFNCALVIMNLDRFQFGIEFIKKVQMLHSGTLLVLSSHATENEEIQILNAGADQYLEIGTPMSVKRCLANVSAIIRRNLMANSDNFLNVGADLKINRYLRKAYVRGKNVHLTPKQFALLNCLIEHTGEIVTKEQLYQEVWRNEYDISADSALKYHIKEVRRKLNEHGVRGVIGTAWGVGYLINLSPDE